MDCIRNVWHPACSGENWNLSWETRLAQWRQNPAVPNTKKQAGLKMSRRLGGEIHTGCSVQVRQHGEIKALRWTD